MTEKRNIYNRLYAAGRPLSEDLRKLIICEIEEHGVTREVQSLPRGIAPKVAQKFKVTKQCVVKIWKLYQTTHSVTHSQMGGAKGPVKLTADDLEYMQWLLFCHPTISLEELRIKLLEYSPNRNADVCLATISNAKRKYLPAGPMTWKKVTNL